MFDEEQESYLHEIIDELQEKIDKLEKFSMPTNCLDNVMTAEWVIKNWDLIVKMQKENKIYGRKY